MPNHITNILKFKGDSEQVHTMLDKIKSDELGFGSIDFNKIIPMPEASTLKQAPAQTMRYTSAWSR